MKQIIYLIVFLIFSQNVLADCAGTGISFWPTGNEIKQNSIIMIDGYAESQHIINGLNKKHAIYLKSGKHRVQLNVLEIHKGQYWTTQAILKPSETLNSGQEYELFIDSLPEYETPLRKWNTATEKYEKVKWKVVNGKDIVEPSFISVPKESSKVLEYYGCGPENYVVFKHKVNDESEYLIKTEVTNLTTNTKSAYYLVSNNDEVYIGHGMCSGAFKLINGQEYEVVFEIIDASGNRSLTTTNKTTFKAAS
jgi:hypothetical protein